VSENEVEGCFANARQDKKGCLAGQRKGAWQEGARDFFEKALGLKFGLTIILA